MQKTGEILEPESERQGLWAIDDTIARLPHEPAVHRTHDWTVKSGATLTASWIPQARGAWARHTLARTFGTPWYLCLLVAPGKTLAICP